MSDAARADVLRQVADQQIAFIDLQFTDILGMVKTVTIPVSELEAALDRGVWFDGSSVEGFARVVESDMYLVADLSTYASVSWAQEAGFAVARLICDVYTPDGERFAGDPRYVLANVLRQAADMGYLFNVGPELEFFLFRNRPDGQVAPMPHDDAGYFDVSTDQATYIRRQMVQALQGFGIGVEASHHEIAVGQHEIDIRYGEALRTADHAVTFRVALKAIAQINGLYATFMPKPIAGKHGSGMHVHLNLTDSVTNRNVFYDAKDPYELSVVARQFIAGLLAHARGMCAILAPLVNSYKRLVPGYEAPVYVSWGRTNRSALVRVPRVSKGRGEATRAELRCPDPSCNPYLAFAVMLAAGLDGIKRELSLREATEEDLFHIDPRARRLEALPSSLNQALHALREDDVVQAALGAHVFERFVDAKQQEWDEYRAHVTQWELDRYLPLF